MDDEPARPSARELFRALLPGAASAGPLLLSLGALAAALLLVGLALFLEVGGRERGALFVGALLAWAHGAVWLTTGTVQRLDSGLADLAGAQWAVFFAAWWLPVAALWGVAGALVG